MTQNTLAAQLAKVCSASVYESDAVRLLLGDSLHPGGAALTRLVAERLNLNWVDTVLDVGCGRGASAVLVARGAGCRVVGMDYGQRNAKEARRAAGDAGLAEQAAFCSGDAEALPFADGVVCECVVSTFVQKIASLSEIRRVLAPGGRLGMSDVTMQGPLSEELRGMVGRVACIGGALSREGYVRLLQEAGFDDVTAEDHSIALADLVKDLQRKVLLARMASRAGVLELPGVDLTLGQRLLSSAEAQVKLGALGYAIFVATAP